MLSASASGTITEAHQTQQVSAAKTRTFWLFQNLSTVTMWLNVGAAATNKAGSLKVMPNSPPVVCSSMTDLLSAQINVFCDEEDASFTFWEVAA